MKKLFLILLAASCVICLFSCASQPDREITFETDHLNMQLTFTCTYSDKYTECTQSVMGPQSASLNNIPAVKKLENGMNQIVFQYDLSKSETTMIFLRFMNGDTVAELVGYRAEVIEGYIVMTAVEGLTSAS